MNDDSSQNREYDLEERLASFSEKIIELCKKVPKNTVTIPIINQIVKSGTSMAANYFEANGASSNKDFKNKIHICKKEAKETELWLRLLAKADETLKDECRLLWKENHEFTLIFSKSISTLNKKNK
ncbi:four helix bundle protein [Candidatus Falkowbacteria bacterium]|nr:four helix bundle protein [Candidatus Falkowbacteria bacterium]